MKPSPRIGLGTALRPTPDVAGGVEQPTLVIGTRYDAGVPFRPGPSQPRSATPS